MRHGLLCVLALHLLGAGSLPAQEPPANDSTPPAAQGQSPSSTPSNAAAADKNGKDKASPAAAPKPPDNCLPFHGWARADYLFWWMRNTPLPVPIVTTGNPPVGFDPNNVNTVNTAGAIGQPGTRVLIGDESIPFRPFSGLRLTAGLWLDDSETFGAEGSGFALERLTNAFTLKSDATGEPPFYFPIFSAIAGAERAIPISDPLRGFSGNVDVRTMLRLWGAEGNGVVTLFRGPSLEWSILGGFRYADLREHLVIDNTTTDLVFANTMLLTDQFETRNQFYGGQLGSRVAVRWNRLTVDATSKVAFGTTHEVVDVLGSITQLGPNPLVPPGFGTFAGGLFAQPSNIGVRTTDRTTVLPALELRAGYDVAPWGRVFVGYDLMYWNHVVRPGNQISHAVNLSQNAVLDPNGTGTLVGPAQPAPLFGQSAFWAQGLTFGLEVRF
jgi:hypothetical protein